MLDSLGYEEEKDETQLECEVTKVSFRKGLLQLQGGGKREFVCGGFVRHSRGSFTGMVAGKASGLKMEKLSPSNGNFTS